MLRKNKKAIALSVNMLVVIILAVVIFVFGVAFLYNILSKSLQLKGAVDEDLDRQMEIVLCDKPVCLSSSYKKIYRGEFEVVGLRIYNTGDSRFFTATVSEPAPPDPKGYDKEGNPLAADDPGLYYVAGAGPDTTIREIEIPARSEKSIGIGIEVPKNAKSGIYVLNVKVNAGGADYPPPQQIRVEVP
jgi:hypothetical protein